MSQRDESRTYFTSLFVGPRNITELLGTSEGAAGRGDPEWNFLGVIRNSECLGWNVLLWPEGAPHSMEGVGPGVS